MAAPRLVRYQSVNALSEVAAQWNDLWRRSHDVLPTGRAELIAGWIQQLAPCAELVVLAVEQDGQFVAALPLMQRRLGGLVPVGSLPRNLWSWAGDFLLDPTADVSAALSVLTAEIRRLPWPLLWFDAVPLKAWRWQQLLAALNAAGHQHLQRERFRMGTVKIVSDAERDWAAYEAAWSGNHRRHMRKALRRAGEAGGVQLDIRRPGNPDEIESLLREGFEVEHRSWKGEHRSSVLSSQVQWDFFLREATQLAESGELELAFLRHAGRAIAFEYGWFSQGIYYTPKVGFDSEFAHLSPGQLLRYLLLKRAFERPEYRAVDFLGPLSEATCKWSTHSYPISKLAIETGNVYGRGLLSLYRNIAGLLRKLRRGRPQCDDNLPLVHIEQQSATGLPSQAVEV